MTAGVEVEREKNPVRDEFRTVGRHTVVYGTGVILGKLASFLMLPIYTRFLSTADYGVLELLAMTIDVISMIAGIGLAGGVFKFYAEFDKAKDRREVMSTVALGTLGLSMCTALAGFAFAEQINGLVFPDGGNPQYFRIFFLIYFFQSAGAPAMLLLRIQERSTAFVAVNLAKLLFSLSLNIYFVVVRGLGVPGVLYANLIVSATTAVVLSAYTFSQVGFSFSMPKFRQMSRFGAPLVVVSVSSFILTFSDRYFLNYFASTSDVGIYALAYRFSFVLSALTVMPFQQVWEPRRFDIARKPEAGAIYRRMFFYYSLALLGGGTVMVALIKDFLTIMAAPEFLPAYRVVPLIVVVTVIQQWTTYSNLGLYLRNRTSLLAWASLTAVAVALTLNWLLIPRFGIFGAAWATVGAYVIRFGIIYALSQAHYRIDYPWGKVSVLGATFLLVCVVRLSISPASLTLSLMLSLGLAAVALTFIYLQLLSRSERATIIGTLGRVRLRRALSTQ